MSKMTQAMLNQMMPITIETDLEQAGISIIPVLKWNEEEIYAKNMSLDVPSGKSQMMVELRKMDYIPPLICFWKVTRTQVVFKMSIWVGDVCLGNADVEATLINGEPVRVDVFEIIQHKGRIKIRNK